MNIVNLKKGSKATINDLSKTSELVKQRLLHMGVDEGKQICLRCVMPFGGPVLIEACGQCISIRRKEALNIGVEKVVSTNCVIR
ncbi:FeoA family protein [Bacillus solimangrovi]|uniref:Iron transporter FeoA n=1 Tax=Bacillus solimangrovi TaxID=1305675 RepID=A0A1E5LHM3_9BACI|nr:FeoA family protein [Bacillus solimangrovi]OEH93580.1 iron transporter FeoA [Bacillus solimangrovi]